MRIGGVSSVPVSGSFLAHHWLVIMGKTVVHFNQKTLKALALPDSGKRRVYDDEVKGFGVLVYAGGTKRFFVMRTVRGRDYYEDLGEWPDVDHVAARARADELRKAWAARPSLQAPSHTLKDAWDTFKRRRFDQLQPRTRREYERLWAAHLEEWGRRQLQDIERADVARLHADLGAQVGPYAANRVRALLSSLYSRAVEWGLVDRVPALPRPHPEEKRTRWLNKVELKALLAVLNMTEAQEVEYAREWENEHGKRYTPVSQMARDFFRVLLFTGARLNEVATMRWDQLHLDRGLWLRVQKGGAEAPTALSSVVVEILRDRKPLVEAEYQGRKERAAKQGVVLPESTPWVFPGRRREGHLSPPKSYWKRICAQAGLEGVRIHDLRHTHASWAAQAGVSLHVVASQLGHRQTSTTERYAHLSNEPRLRAVELVVGEMTREDAG